MTCALFYLVARCSSNIHGYVREEGLQFVALLVQDSKLSKVENTWTLFERPSGGGAWTLYVGEKKVPGMANWEKRKQRASSPSIYDSVANYMRDVSCCKKSKLKMPKEDQERWDTYANLYEAVIRLTSTHFDRCKCTKGKLVQAVFMRAWVWSCHSSMVRVHACRGTTAYVYRVGMRYEPQAGSISSSPVTYMHERPGYMSAHVVLVTGNDRWTDYMGGVVISYPCQQNRNRKSGAAERPVAALDRPRRALPRATG